jgi:hypothetical protein
MKVHFYAYLRKVKPNFSLKTGLATGNTKRGGEY